MGSYTEDLRRAIEEKNARKAAEEKARYGDLNQQSGYAGLFANGGEINYGNLTTEGRGVRDHLRGQMLGDNSLSSEQLRQGLQQNVAGQQAMAASASPANGPMAARTAMMTGGRLGSGYAGQQALAGIAERNAAAQSLGGMISDARGQDLVAANTGRANAIAGLGDVMRDQTARYVGKPVDHGPSNWDRALNTAMTGASIYAMSDRRLKSGIADGDMDADRFLKGLKAYRFRYTDEKHGKGEQLGIMAQDLERSGLGKQAVFETPEGKAVNGAKLATAIAATLPGLNKRLAKLEGQK